MKTFWIIALTCATLGLMAAGCGDDNSRSVACVTVDRQSASVTLPLSTLEADLNVSCDDNDVTLDGAAGADDEARASCLCPSGWVPEDGRFCLKLCASEPCTGGSDCIGGTCSGVGPAGVPVCEWNSLCGSEGAAKLISSIGRCGPAPCDDYNDCTIDAMTPKGCAVSFAPPGVACGDGAGKCDSSGWCVVGGG